MVVDRNDNLLQRCSLTSSSLITEVKQHYPWLVLGRASSGPGMGRHIVTWMTTSLAVPSQYNQNKGLSATLNQSIQMVLDVKDPLIQYTKTSK